MQAISARKYLMDSDNTVHSQMKLEQVNTYYCPQRCLFNNENNGNQWCVKMSPPLALGGWTFQQQYSQTSDAQPVHYWQVKSGVYLQGQFFMESIFNVMYVYYNNFTAEIKKFQWGIWFVQTFTSKFQWCPGVGWNIQSVDLNLAVR